MALDTKLVGTSSGNGAEVDSSNRVLVRLPDATTPANVGGVRIFSENDSGSITGTPYLYSPETTDDYRLRTVIDTVLDQEVFCYANQNTGKHNYLATTMTAALSSNALTTNATSVTTLNTGVAFRTWQYFPMWGAQVETYVDTRAAFSAALTTNTTIDWGLFIHSGSNPYAPSDGVYFRATSSGVYGVINFNGSETTTSVFSFTPTINRVYSFAISVSTSEIKFWIDDVLYGSLNVQTGNGSPMAAMSLPWQVRHAIGGTAAGAALQFKIFAYSVQVNDCTNIPFAKQMSLMGGSAQVQQGATTGGQLTTYALGAEPGVVTLTANTAPATNTLGGLFLLPVAITPAASDYPLFAWQNPAGTAAIPGKTFICTGVRIGEMSVTTALTGGPLLFTYALGYGSTAATLATTETTTFTATTTKIARKIPLGMQSLAASSAVGTISPGFQVDLSSAPIPINPGEFLHIILRVPGGTATTGGAPRGSVAILGYFR